MEYIARIPGVLAIVSRLDVMDPSSNNQQYDYGCSSVTIEEMSIQKSPVWDVKGSVAAWHRQLFDKPLPSGLVHEDTFLQYRAFCRGRILYIPERLVNVRIDVGVTGTLYRLSLDRALSYADYLAWDIRQNRAFEWKLFFYEHLVKEFDYLKASNEHLYRMFTQQVYIRRYQARGGVGNFLSCCVEAIRRRDSQMLYELGRDIFKHTVGTRCRFFLRICYVRLRGIGKEKKKC
jgi:hypothetical protein